MSSSSPSSSSSSSSPSLPVPNYQQYVFPDTTGANANWSPGGGSLPVRRTVQRQRRSNIGSSNCARLARPRSHSVKTSPYAKTNKMKVHHLWEFIHELLELSELQEQASMSGYVAHEMAPVRWESKEHGVFRIVDSKRIAKLWGAHKRNSTMTYEKLSRSLRWCRSSGYLSEVPKNANYPKKLCFRFGHRAVDVFSAGRQTC